MTDINRNGFKANYQILETNAERLNQGDDVDIDELVNLVEQSTAAYNACKARLAAVKTALEKQISPGNISGAGSVTVAAGAFQSVPRRQVAESRPVQIDDVNFDDEIPF